MAILYSRITNSATQWPRRARVSKTSPPSAAAVEEGVALLKVSHASGNPLLFLDRKKHPWLPSGWTTVWVDDTAYELNFVKVAVNVARRPGETGNALHGLLRESDGAPGRHHQGCVGWSVNTGVVTRTGVPFAAAAGHVISAITRLSPSRRTATLSSIVSITA